MPNKNTKIEPYTVLASRIDPSHIPGIQRILESFHAWNGGGYQFISPDEANAMVERKELSRYIDHWERGGQRAVYGPYKSWLFICKTERAAREVGFGFATVTQRMCDMLEAYQAARVSMEKAIIKVTRKDEPPKPKFRKSIPISPRETKASKSYEVSK